MGDLPFAERRGRFARMRRLTVAAALVGAMCLAFAVSSLFEGRGRDAIESGLPGLLLIAPAALALRKRFGRR
jgi:hypothetical protein